MEPAQVLSTVMKPTVMRKPVANYTFSNVVGGLDGTKGWGVSLSFREAGETVSVDLTSVHEVYVCLAMMENTILDFEYLSNQAGFSPTEIAGLIILLYREQLPAGVPVPLSSAKCEQEHLLKTGNVIFNIPRPENYTLIVGKAAGYLASSFAVEVGITKTEEAMVTETITITTLTTRTLW